MIKFEEKVKQKEKKLEEVTRNQNDFKDQLIESQEVGFQKSTYHTDSILISAIIFCRLCKD